MTEHITHSAAPVGSIDYATPKRQGPRVWAAAVVMLGGLGLILLGGCFLIGVLAVVEPMGFNPPEQPQPLTARAYIFMMVLYALAFASFAGAVAVIVVGLRGLSRIMNGA